MSQSFTYYLTIFVLKLKGLKKIFSEDPINYKKLRKEDVHQPKGAFFKKHLTTSFTVLNTQISEITGNKASDKLVLFIHGGAFISGPAQHHWDTIKQLVNKTNHTIWLCNYPKAPENKISEISNNIDLVYQKALEKYAANQITLLGDSVGGTLITALTQRLLQNGHQPPHKLILVSPVMDASMTNAEIDAIDKVDPMVSKVGLVSAKKMALEDYNLKNPMISPVYGSFENFPTTILFAGTHDITYPDQIGTAKKLQEANVSFELIEGEKMPHIWPLLPVMKEAKTALKEIIRSINETQDSNA